MKPVRTWILIADGGRARVLSNAGRGHGLSAIPGLVFEAELPMAHELGSDRPGRSYESQGHTRHAIEPHSDPHEKLKHAFIGRVVDMLSAKLQADAFDRLVLVAPPSILGLLRASLSQQLQQVLLATVDKDLTKHPNDEIAAHLGELPF